jgi:hypothetical protein
MNLDRLHFLLTTRFVCEACTTRLYSLYPVCPGCQRTGYIRPLYAYLHDHADSEEAFRSLILGGQREGVRADDEIAVKET